MKKSKLDVSNMQDLVDGGRRRWVLVAVGAVVVLAATFIGLAVLWPNESVGDIQRVFTNGAAAASHDHAPSPKSLSIELSSADASTAGQLLAGPSPVHIPRPPTLAWNPLQQTARLDDTRWERRLLGPTATLSGRQARDREDEQVRTLRPSPLSIPQARPAPELASLVMAPRPVAARARVEDDGPSTPPTVAHAQPRETGSYVDSEQVRALQVKHEWQLETCYEATGVYLPRWAVPRKTMVRIELARGGTVSKVSVAAGSDRPLARCLSSAVSSWRFPTSARQQEISFPIIRVAS